MRIHYHCCLAECSWETVLGFGLAFPLYREAEAVWKELTASSFLRRRSMRVVAEVAVVRLWKEEAEVFVAESSWGPEWDRSPKPIAESSFACPKCLCSQCTDSVRRLLLLPEDLGEVRIRRWEETAGEDSAAMPAG